MKLLPFDLDQYWRSYCILKILPIHVKSSQAEPKPGLAWLGSAQLEKLTSWLSSCGALPIILTLVTKNCFFYILVSPFKRYGGIFYFNVQLLMLCLSFCFIYLLLSLFVSIFYKRFNKIILNNSNYI